MSKNTTWVVYRLWHTVANVMRYKQHHHQPRPAMFCQSSLQLVIDNKVHGCYVRCTMPWPYVMSSCKRYCHYKDHDYAFVCVCVCVCVHVCVRAWEAGGRSRAQRLTDHIFRILKCHLHFCHVRIFESWVQIEQSH